jgi:hypothetical protein
LVFKTGAHTQSLAKKKKSAGTHFSIAGKHDNVPCLPITTRKKKVD